MYQFRRLGFDTGPLLDVEICVQGPGVGLDDSVLESYLKILGVKFVLEDSLRTHVNTLDEKFKNHVSPDLIK